MHQDMEFTVTICMGGGDGGDEQVWVDVTDEEYELLKRCCREGEEMDNFDGLEELCSRVAAEAVGESIFDGDDQEEEDYDSASFIYQIPDEIYDAVEEEDCPEGDEDILERAFHLLEQTDGEELLEEFLDKNDGRYTGNLREEVFRKAIFLGNESYIRAHADEIDLNDAGDHSTYLDETDDEQIQDLLIELGAFRSWDSYDDCRFAMETLNGSVLAMDEDLQSELWKKYLPGLGVTKEELAEILNEEAERPEHWGPEVEDDLHTLGVTVKGTRIRLEDLTGEDVGWEIKELLERFGWDCDFEGDSWKFETNGVYFIR